MPTVSYGIANTADNVVELPAVNFTDTVVANGDLGGLAYIGGLRFTGVAVPQAATITSATLTLKKDAANSSAGPWGAWKGVNVDNAPAWTTTGPNAASKTTQSVTIVDGATQNYDVAAIVQAIVNRAGWASGNALAFAGDATGATGVMSWVDYGSSTTDCAQLSITYTTGPDVTPPTITSGNTASVLEGEPFSLSLTANETVAWSIVGGADAGHFSLAGNALSMTGKSFSAPSDSNANNTYAVTIRATDAAMPPNTTDQTITVTVTQAPMIRFVGAATGTTSATIPAHRAGDLILAFAFRDGSTTASSLPTGQDWTSLSAPGGVNTCSMRLASKIADSASEATGTFTNATSLIVHVYRPRPGYTLSAGAGGTNAGSTTTVNYPSLALQDTSGNSIVTAFAGHRSTNTALENAPAGMVARSSVVDATDEAAGHDTNGGVTSWASTNVSVGGTASGWWSVVREIRATAIVATRRAIRSFRWL